MKTIAIIATCLLLGGCSGPLNKALRLSQSISGTGSVEIDNIAGTAKVAVTNARVEGDRYKADQIAIEARGAYPGMGSVKIEATDYSRPLVKGADAE